MYVYAASGTQPAPGRGAQPPNELAGPNTPYSVIVLLEWTEEPTDHHLSLVATAAQPAATARPAFSTGPGSNPGLLLSNSSPCLPLSS